MMVVHEYVSSILPKRSSPCNDGRYSAQSDRIPFPLSKSSTDFYGQIEHCTASPGDWGCDMEERAYFDSYRENINQSRPSTTGAISSFSPEGRLARSLKRWMPSYEMKLLTPQPFPPRQPVYSARLADRIRIKRSDSSESLNTQISLLSCSTHLSNSQTSPKRRRRRKKKQADQNEDGTEKKSIWIQLANRGSGGELDRMLRKHAMYALQDTDTEIFKNLDYEEKEMVTQAGMCLGLRLGPGRQRSDSTSNTHKKLPQRKRPQRTLSAGGKHEGPMLNFQEVRRQMINQRLALQSHRSRHSGRKSLSRSLSRVSLLSNSSSDIFPIATPRETSPLQMVEETVSSSDNQVSVWKGDSQILAIDLKRGLTAKVKSKIATTTSALERVTGYGEDNESKFFVGSLEEYPYLVEQDYSHIAKVPQRVRISPHLSHVIKTDIHVRMGRPRYHEIKVEDINLWNKGQVLDRSHRNLKVFNWLHSLRESDFDMTLPEGVVDIPPGGDVTTRDETIVAVDEPKIKPLLERLKTEFIV